MKLSRYNFLRKIDDVTIFFNSMTCALAVVDENFLRAYHEIENGSFDESQHDPKLIEDMKSSGCIVEDDFDEIQILKFNRNLAKFDMSSLALTIAPTLACNFRCKYCFEQHKSGLMSDQIQNDLIEFVENRLKSAKNFSVTWYGGEPLIAKKIVYDLSQKFLDLCERFNAKYDAFIITNASLMKDEDIESFKRFKIRGAQITIDGPPKIHDARRISIDGSSTFDKLVNRANDLLNANLEVIVRINIDKENLEHVDELLEILRDRIERHEKLKIDFGQVSSFTEICKSIESDCYNNDQYAEILLPLYAKVLSMGFSMNKMSVYPNPRANFCCTDYVNSFVVDERGLLYRCWNHVGNEKFSCGSLSNLKDKMPTSNRNYLSWINWNPIEHEKCSDCKFLPICMGGCPDAMRNSADKNPICGTIKFNLERVIEFYYQQLKGEIA